MNRRRYTVLGWLIWQLVSLIVKRQITSTRVKLGAAGVAGAVLVAGVLAAKAGGDDGD